MAAIDNGDLNQSSCVLQQLRDPVVRGISYDCADVRLVLGFRNGRTVEYLCVPRIMYAAFIDAQPRSWDAVGRLLRRYRQRELPPTPVSANQTRHGAV
jgi:hypothetical protein